MSRQEVPDCKTDILICDKFPIDLNRNLAFDLALSNKYEADFVMCCDMDQVFKKDTILKLMQTLKESPDAGAATGIYFRKTPPHKCVVGKFSPWSESLNNKRAFLQENGFVDQKTGEQTLFYKPLQFFDVVQPVDAFGLGCILFRSDALRKIKQPFCKYLNAYFLGGDFTFEGCSEDMWMCSQLKQAGVKVLCNPKVQVGHVVEKVIIGNESEEA
jgi:cellulose synthase/poly-beta-1,6-N-acetylglucosamine synthase-like glycosyltransferase